MRFYATEDRRCVVRGTIPFGLERFSWQKLEWVDYLPHSIDGFVSDFVEISEKEAIEIVAMARTERTQT